MHEHPSAESRESPCLARESACTTPARAGQAGGDPSVAKIGAKAFTAWHLTRHGVEPDLEAVDALAAEWLEGTLPGTRHAASPHRAQYQLNLISDWISEHPVTVAAKALLPEWVRWNGEQAGLPEHLIDRAVGVAAGDPRAVADWAAESL